MSERTRARVKLEPSFRNGNWTYCEALKVSRAFTRQHETWREINKQHAGVHHSLTSDPTLFMQNRKWIVSNIQL